MLTGTPLDLTPFGAVLQGIGVLYWLLVLLALAVALWKPERWRTKLIAATLVLGFMVGPLAYHAYQDRQKAEAAKVRFEAAWARFQERCKSAGERIERREHDVEGVYLIKVRPNSVNYDEQFTKDDVYGHDTGGEDYIKSFLRATEGLALDPDRRLPHHRGYAWVEASDPKDGKLYRFRLRLFRPSDRDPKWLKTLVDPELVREPIAKPSARYGVTWEDISTREDREHWIAGGSIRVIDLQTKEVIAERRGYMFDRGMGSRAGGRSPWGFAEFDACPPFSGKLSSGTRARTMRESWQFVQSVLQPIQ